MAAPKGNKYYLLARLKETNGRPRLFNKPEEILDLGFEYFETANENDNGKITISGLRLWLGMTESSWRDYKKHKEFSRAIWMLTEILKDYNEKKLSWAGSFVGAQYWLKCQGGDEWQDTQKQEITGSIKADFGSNIIHTSQESSEDT